MIFAKVISVLTLVTLAMARPPVDPHAPAYSIITKHQVHHDHHNSDNHNVGHLSHGSSSHHESRVHHGSNVHHQSSVHHEPSVHHGLSVHHSLSPISHDHHHDDHHEEHHNSHPQYKYDYGVKDHHTGDKKDAWEKRDGDVVRGGYSLDEADGTKRIVEYTSDHKHGFNASVKRLGHAKHPKTITHHDSHHKW